MPSLYIDGAVGRLRRRHLQPGRSTRPTPPSSPRSTSPPTPRSRPRSRPPAAPSTRPTGRARRPASARPCSIVSPGSSIATSRTMARLETHQHRQGDAREPLGHGRRRARVPLLRRARRQGRRTAGRHRATRTRSVAIVYEPVGVCGLIGPWNYPLLQLSWKIAPGPGRRQHGRHEARPAHAADGDPPDPPARGGRRPGRRRQPHPRAGRTRVGQALADSPDVDLISLTGGLEAGRSLMRGRGRQRQAGRARDSAARARTSSSTTATSRRPSTTP